MIYQDLLVIKDGSPDTFFGVLTIITVVVLIYALAFSEIARKRVAKAKEAKRVAVEGLNMRKLQKQVDEDEEEDEYEY